MYHTSHECLFVIPFLKHKTFDSDRNSEFLSPLKLNFLMEFMYSYFLLYLRNLVNNES